MGWPVIIAEAVIAAGGTAVTLHGQHKAAGKAEEARKQQAALSAAKNKRAQKKAIARQRIAAARIANQAALSGITGSSGPAGGIASSRAELGGAIGFQQSIIDANNRRLSFMSSAAEHQQHASDVAAIGGLVGSIDFSSLGSGTETPVKGQAFKPDIKLDTQDLRFTGNSDPLSNMNSFRSSVFGSSGG